MSQLLFILSLSCLSACQHFDPTDTIRQEKVLNLAIIVSDDYSLIENARCTITTDSQDKIETHLNPDALTLKTDYQSLSIECSAPGYTQKSLAITNTINSWSAIDLFMLPPGDIIDTSSSLLPYYPSHILVLMSKKPLTQSAQTEKVYQKSQAENLLYQGTLA